jgi:putative phosphoesterase
VSDAPPAPSPFRIGVISDTHGNVPGSVSDAFAGVDAIIHAGDVGPGYPLEELRAIAPVTAVCGNCDVGGHGVLPLAANTVLGGVRIVVAHRERDLAGSLDPVRAGARVAITGHSHVAAIGERDGVLWVNPGSPSFPRGGQERSVAIISVGADGSVTAEVVPLP